jgi:tryptophan 2,3-dioxygenase
MLVQVGARTAERDVAAMSYTEFIQLDQLLDLQYQIPGAPDSLFFVIAHQVTELWFRVVLHELDLTRSAMDADDLREARYRLNRVVRGEDVLVAHLRAVETISPGNFALIRQHLGTSSAFESVQFREIEFLSGRKDRRYLDSSRLTDVERVRLRARFTEPSLVDALAALLDRRGQPDLREVMAGRSDPELCALIDALLEHDLGIARWRAGHAQMAERIIGYRTGTGGSTGVEYLQGTTGSRFFPDLWEIRSAL